jgi:hypothetical protein
LQFGLKEAEISNKGQNSAIEVGQHGTEFFRIRAAHSR